MTVRRRWVWHMRMTGIFCVLLLFLPGQVNAGLGLSFDLFSVGPFSVGIGIPLRGVLGALAVGALVVSFFSSTGHRSYAASYDSYAADHESRRVLTIPIRQIISMNPEDHLRGRPLRMRFSQFSWFEDGQIPLPKGGHLELQEDGKMVFRDADFEGYAYLLYDDSFTVWDEEDNPVLVLKPNWNATKGDEPRTLLLLEKSSRSTKVLEVLFGKEVSL